MNRTQLRRALERLSREAQTLAADCEADAKRLQAEAERDQEEDDDEEQG